MFRKVFAKNNCTILFYPFYHRKTRAFFKRTLPSEPRNPETVMFPSKSLRKPSPSISRAFANQRLKNPGPSPASASSSPSPPSSSPIPSTSTRGHSSSCRDQKHRRETHLTSFISYGAVVAGLGLWCNISPAPSEDENSSLCFVDSSKEAVWINEDDELPDFPAKKPKFLFGDAYRRRIFFNYEKRIRSQSSPEKVFEYFASFRTPSGEILMTPAELMRSIVPVFPPSESDRVREGSLRGEMVSPEELHCPPSQFFMLFDTNNDGLISFPEYIFFVTLLSIPESSFSVAFKMFDLDTNGEIDRDEFKKVMTLMRSQSRQGSCHRDGRRAALFRPAEPVENGGLIEYFFGKEGENRLSHDKFVQFLRDLHDEILRLEFAHYDYKLRGTISAKDFALSLVASADISHISKLLDRVDEINEESPLKDIRITFEEFKNFAELRRKLKSFSLAIFSCGKVNGKLTKTDFQRATSQVCEISITKAVIDIIFHVFDADRDGSLSLDEFVRVLQRREGEASRPRETVAQDLIPCWLNCVKNCTRSTDIIRDT